jgi:hypothetical protein
MAKKTYLPKKYEYHPIANLFPLMTEAELEVLAEDIKANGLKVRILLYEGKILDGRNRYLACLKAKVRPLFQKFTQIDPVRWCLSLNLHRRHLTTSQRAAIAAELATLPQGARTDLASNEARMSQQQAADIMTVSRSSVQRAREVREADPELHEKVKAGEVSRADAERIIDAGSDPPSESNGDHKQEAASNVTPFSDERSRPLSDEEKWVRQFKNLVKDLSEEFRKPPVEIRGCIRQYLEDHR